jgi:hypothetical protein
VQKNDIRRKYKTGKKSDVQKARCIFPDGRFTVSYVQESDNEKNAPPCHSALSSPPPPHKNKKEEREKRQWFTL